MKISINLATRPFADLGPILRQLRIAMGVLAGLALALALGLHFVHNKAEVARARAHSLDGALAHVNQERQGYQQLMQQPDNAQVLSEASSLNKLIDEKAFSWTLAMEDLETVLPGGVQVTTLEPVREKDGHITLRLRVVGPRDLAVDLVKNLEHSKRFLQPRIVSESSEAPSGANQQLEPVSAANRVNFDVLAEYNPATTGERKAPTTKPSQSVPAEANTRRPSDAANAKRPGLRRAPRATPRPKILKPQAGDPQ